MRCKEIELLLAEYYANSLDPKSREEVEQHLLQCESCKLRLKEIEQIHQLLAKESVPSPEESFWTNFLPEVRARIERKEKRKLIFVPKTHLAFGLSSVLAWFEGLVRWARPTVAVAVLLICIFLGYSLGNFPQTVNGQTISQVDERTIALQEFFDSHYLNPLNDLPTSSIEATYLEMISEE